MESFMLMMTSDRICPEMLGGFVGFIIHQDKFNRMQSRSSSRVRQGATYITPPAQGSLGDSTFVLSSNDLTGLVELADNYRFAGGGYGDIFEGNYKRHGKVALKRPHDIPDETEIYRFLREVDIWCSVKHQYILPCLGRCKIGRDIYMVSPLIENGDLMACIRQGKLLNRRKIIYEVGTALAHLHEKGIIHGDVKGSNVLLSNDGGALLCDFGLSKVFDTMRTSTAKKGLGSTRWMAPELFLDGDRTARSDVYSFGITIAEILSGRVPFYQLQDNSAVMHHVLNGNGRPAKEPMVDQEGKSNAELWDIAEECWDLDIHKRPTMAQVLDSTEFMEIESEDAPMTPLSEQPDDIADSEPFFESMQPSPFITSGNDLTGLVSLESSHRIMRGGVADIFSGYYEGYGTVAIKRPIRILGQIQIRRFIREADIWRSAAHPYILPCFGTCRIGRDIYLVSPLVTNGDLLTYMRKGINFDRVKLLYEVALAITHIHHLGIVHGNIKSQSILISDMGSPLLCSFAFAKASDNMATSTDAKGFGSLRWMAHELFEGAGRSLASDVYSFGITIAEVLSGHIPFNRLSTEPAALMHILKGGRPPKEPLTSPEGRPYSVVWEIAERCWAHDPEVRPSMAMVLGMLFPATRVRVW